MKILAASSSARHVSHAAFLLLELGTGGAFLGVVAHHVAALNFRPLAAFCLPVMVAFVGFTSLLFVRGRSLRRGRAQIRTLFAAECAMQATIWYFTGIMLGLGMYGLLQLVPGGVESGAPRLALVAFVAPYLLMQGGMVLFLRAARVVAPQFLRRVSPYEVWRRIQDDEPAAAGTCHLPGPPRTA
jgi:hypothetical protein